MTGLFMVRPAALLVSGGSVNAPLTAQASKAIEERSVRAFAQGCAKRVAVNTLDANALNDAFVTPGATYTNGLLGADALTLPNFLNGAHVQQ